MRKILWQVKPPGNGARRKSHKMAPCPRKDARETVAIIRYLTDDGRLNDGGTASEPVSELPIEREEENTAREENRCHPCGRVVGEKELLLDRGDAGDNNANGTLVTNRRVSFSNEITELPYRPTLTAEELSEYFLSTSEIHKIKADCAKIVSSHHQWWPDCSYDSSDMRGLENYMDGRKCHMIRTLHKNAVLKEQRRQCLPHDHPELDEGYSFWENESSFSSTPWSADDGDDDAETRLARVSMAFTQSRERIAQDRARDDAFVAAARLVVDDNHDVDVDEERTMLDNTQSGEGAHQFLLAILQHNDPWIQRLLPACNSYDRSSWLE